MTKCSPKYVCGIMILLTIIFLSILLYIRIWEMSQDVFLLENVTIKSISPYYNNGGDLHWSSSGYRIYVNKDERNIDYPASKWNNNAKIGSKATLEVRQSFFNNELDGISINIAR